jgi:UDP-2,3-diacylglucosamine hydrolase
VSGKVFFASDFHLGLDAGTNPADREKRVIRWLNSVAPGAREIFLLGDVFDFWWEYKKVVPRGFTRFLGTISSITDTGLPVHFFRGNHDMWIGRYLEEECGIIIHSGPFITNLDGKVFYLAHGEGLGTRSFGYKALLALFRNRPMQRLYSALHPSVGMSIGHRWSLSSRLGKGMHLDFLGEEKEDLFRHSKKILESEKIDYFIYGHRHLPLTYRLPQGAIITILGDWIMKDSYAEWNGSELLLKNTGQS